MITVPYWWHATLLELLWLGGGVVATWLTALNLRDAWKDKEALAEILADPAVHDLHYRMIELAAKGRASSQVFRLAIGLLIVAAGTVGCVVANPLGGRTTSVGFVVTIVLDGISLLTAVRAYFDLRDRNRLYAMATARTAVLAAKLRAGNPGA